MGGPVTLGYALTALVLSYLVYSAGVALYNITLHPLAKFAGPRLRGAFFFPYHWAILAGHEVRDTQSLHTQYGQVVRLNPNTLSFSTSQAWKDIYGHRQGRRQFPRDPAMHPGLDGPVSPNIIISSDADHARMRHLLSHAFSESALREQEHLIVHYLDRLIVSLQGLTKGPERGNVDLAQWYNFTTFDVLGDLCFDEPFGALESGEYHPWVASIFKFTRFAATTRAIRGYPIFTSILTKLLKLTGLIKAGQKHAAFTAQKAAARLDRITDRKDFMSYIMRHNDEKGMNRREIMVTSGVLIVAGSETIATLLCGATFHLLRNPAVLARVQEEVRSAFGRAEDMTFKSVSTLPYMNACLEEAMRIYPPLPTTMRRMVVPDATVIDGIAVPANTMVGVNFFAAHRSERNFKDAGKYVPERWLGDERYASDDRAAMQPFSMGPRGCLGKNLAYAESRAIMARMLWHFDMELSPESKNWDDQRVFLIWDKPPLKVNLKARTV